MQVNRILLDTVWAGPRLRPLTQHPPLSNCPPVSDVTKAGAGRGDRPLLSLGLAEAPQAGKGQYRGQLAMDLVPAPGPEPGSHSSSPSPVGPLRTPPGRLQALSLLPEPTNHRTPSSRHQPPCLSMWAPYVYRSVLSTPRPRLSLGVGGGDRTGTPTHLYLSPASACCPQDSGRRWLPA